jgi:hypothetical protein
VWNVTDNLGRHLGQAATFFSWDPIAQEEAN